MKDYKQILILHSLDKSTAFLGAFKDEFPENYFFFNSDVELINQAKGKLADLDEPSLIIYLGHGSSSGLYIPSEENNYNDLFIDINWGNIYFENNDVLLLSCRSNELIKRIYKFSSAIGFGNIISSKYELDFHNENNEKKKKLNIEDIIFFNDIYVKLSMKIVDLIVQQKIEFFSAPKYYTYFLNKEINNILLDKKNAHRVEIAKLLFEFRNEILIVKN